MNIKEAIEKLNTPKKEDLITMLRRFKREGIENFVITKTEIIETVLAELEKQSKIINLMAEQLRTPVNSKEWVIDYYERKIKEDK